MNSPLSFQERNYESVVSERDLLRAELTKWQEAARQLRRMAEVEADSDKLRTALHDIFELASRQKSNRDCAIDEGLIDTAMAAVRVIRKVCDERKDDFATYNQKIQEWWWLLGEARPNLTYSDMEYFMREHGIKLEKP